jgi:hypothetical protein
MADNLAEILGQATEAVGSNNATDFAPVEAPAAEPTPDYSADFTDDVPEAEVVDDEEPVRVHSAADLKKSARRWIDFVDNLQKPLLVASYRKTILHPGDEERMDAHEQQRAQRGRFSIEDAVTEDSTFYHVLTRAREFTDLCDKAAFTEDEKESLTGPLAEVLERHSRLQLSPEMALLLAVAMVMLPRVAPLIPQFRKGFNL